MRTVGKETDLVQHGDVLRDIDELNMINEPIDKEDVRVQMLGTVP